MSSNSSIGTDASPLERSLDWVAGGGEMGALVRSLDWSKTALGPLGAWPQSLRTIVSTCLSSRFPILIWWGPDLVMIYNDAIFLQLLLNDREMLGEGGINKPWNNVINWSIIVLFFGLSLVLAAQVVAPRLFPSS